MARQTSIRQPVTLGVLLTNPKSPDAPARLKAIRRTLKMNQRKFARALGVQPETVCRWEQGKQSMQRPCATCLKYFLQLWYAGLVV
jgi:DNA-binding transcriptional regulator YiaG